MATSSTIESRETVSLIGSDKVEGTAVYGADQKKIGKLERVRWQCVPVSGALVSLSGADPLNLAGILTPGPRLAALTGNRLLYRDGVPIALLAAGEVQFLETLDAASEWAAHKALLRSAVPGPQRAPDAVRREARADKSRHSAHERA